MSESFVPSLSFEGKRVCVLGFGMEGVSACDFLLSYGASVSVFDERSREHFDEEKVVSFEERGVEFYFGGFESLLPYDMIVRSPGIRLNTLVIQEAIEAGILVTSCTKLFFDLCPCPVIGVTGTKGKGTTSTLIFEMLKRSGENVFLAGNIGEPCLQLLPNLTPESYVVLELSSFQLLDLHRSPHIAVLLMIVPEHMDYHADFSEYLEAKRNLVRFQTSSDFAIFNHDYPPSNESDVLTSGKVLCTSRVKSVLEGCYVEEGVVYSNFKGKLERVISTKEIKLVGKHNLDNVCAAILVAQIVGVSISDIAQVLREFGGLPYRLELVREVDGVSYYNDSFSTIPETTMAAVEAFEQPKVLILGGSSKNSDFSELGRVINGANIRGIVGIGEEWERIKPEIKNGRFALIEGKRTMGEMVEAARSIAKPGDVVLLSPACASFDMFKSYKERGDLFRQEVNKLI